MTQLYQLSSALISFKWVQQGAGWESFSLLLLLWLPLTASIPSTEFGYCFVFSLCDIKACGDILSWLKSAFCSSPLSAQCLSGCLPRDNNRWSRWLIFYFTITQLLSCCCAARHSSCMSGSALHTAGLDMMGKGPGAAEWGCCWIPEVGWGWVCWLMCRRASRR